MMPTPPIWTENSIESFADVLRLVGEEGATRLFIDPVDHWTDRLCEWLREHYGFKVANEVDTFYFNIMTELAQVSVQLGYGLALSKPNMHFDSFEDWLQAGIVAGSLEV